MKRASALLFSLVLIVSQVAFSSGVVNSGGQKASTPKCCGHCGPCKGGCCCVHNNDPAPGLPTPAVPSRGISQNDLSMFIAVSLQLPLPGGIEPVIPFASHHVLPISPAPLYQRNCSYLI
jgi:hypothetical protein